MSESEIRVEDVAVEGVAGGTEGNSSSRSQITAPSVIGQLIDSKTIGAAMELDRRIRECLRDYVQLGKLLIEMRDEQAYKLVGPYDTFEDYCKDVEGLHFTTACMKIRAYLVHKAIEENLGYTKQLPSQEIQVRRLFEHKGAIAKFRMEKRVIEKRDGTKTPVVVPVAVANAKQIAEQWEAIVEAHRDVVDRSRRQHESKVNAARLAGEVEPAYRRPKLTGTFVVNQLPYQHQPPRKTSGKPHHFVRWIGKVMAGVEAIEKMHNQGAERWNRLTSDPERQRLDQPVIACLVKDLGDAIKVLEKFSADLESEFRS